MTDDIPQWAKERAYALSYADQRRFDDPDSFMLSRVATAFARYIAEREQPPVDPLLVEAREIALRYSLPGSLHGITTCRTNEGQADHMDAVQCILAALKRGIELGKGCEQ